MTDEKRGSRRLSEWKKLAPPPEIPMWVPERMKEVLAHTIYVRTSNLNEVALLKRIATDLRMKKVWVELTKKKRSKGEQKYFHSKPRPDWAKDEDSWHFTTLELLFRDIFVYGKLCIPEVSGGLPKGIEQKRDKCRQAETELERDAWFVSRLAGKSKGPLRAYFAKLARQFEKAALAYVDLSMLLDRGYFDGKELVAILFCSMTATKMRDTLGSPKYGLVAIIASIVLEREIKPTDVRQWCGGPWGIPLRPGYGLSREAHATSER
jgi:hypothetical protein